MSRLLAPERRGVSPPVRAINTGDLTVRRSEVEADAAPRVSTNG
jgi:hypothetical protein